MSSLKGYRRDDGTIGVRNDVVLIPLSTATAPVATRLASEHGPAVKAAPHEVDPDRSDRMRERAERVLAGIGCNPNVGGILVVGLGYETTQSDSLAAQIADGGVPAEEVAIQDAGGTERCYREGRERVEAVTDAEEKRPVPVSGLTVGVVG